MISNTTPYLVGTEEVVLDETENASEVVNVGKRLAALTRRARNVATVGALV